jgi:hypothetical protein
MMPNSYFTSAAGSPKTSPLPFNVIVCSLPRLALLLLREPRITVAGDFIPLSFALALTKTAA